MSELMITYININVSEEQDERDEVVAASGQELVPVLVDGDVVLDDEEKILAYLDEKYGNKSQGGRPTATSG